MKIFVTLLTLFVSVSISKISYAEWYCNQRFDLCIEYPDGFIPQGESENGDGQLFLSEDEQADFLVYGRLIQPEYDNEFEGFVSAEEMLSTITYKVVHDEYCIMSGYTEQGKIFYQKVRYLEEDRLHYWVMRIEYPKSQKKKFDQFCNMISNF